MPDAFVPSRRHLVGLLTLLGVGFLRARAVAATPPGPENEWRIGSSAALTGPAAQLGLRYHAGIRAQLALVNQQGGIQGRKVVLDLRDDGYEPERAEVNTRQLVEDERVLLLFGYVGTPTSRAALPYLKRHGISFMGAYTGAGMLYEPSLGRIFSIRASYLDESLALADAMKRDGVKRFNVLLQADLFGRAGLEAMRDAAQGRQLTLQASATVRRNSTDVGEALDALITRAPADAIFMISTYETCAAFIRQARKRGYTGRFYLLSFAGLEPLQQALQGDMRQVRIAQVVPDPRDPILPVTAAYQKAMLAQGDRQFDSISFEGYIAARVLCEGLLRAQRSHGRDGVQQALERVGELDLGGFRVRYNENSHRGSSLVLIR
ncbi:ABC transporter substrate-binding protein [Pelomonas sp. APW6]|uniref:ABC transporter substrate-binding protein n=1 Tax=Roseateles subflavus TaxID=3053353 RepID=A0ABT7LFR1_9BURK|nr:ABC transporter substrate-binding protein [Pelomonas sp. APW6]MDL5031299.1 ABC transporter substrate-binding protein [Pelomonas sp. APW6]